MGCTVLALVGSFVPALPPVASLTDALTPVLGPAALGALLHAVGISGVVFGWLITRVESRICGIAYTELVEWEFPWLFRGYFLVFLPTYLLGIYASGNGGLFWPTLFAFLEISCHVVTLIWACLKYVVNPLSRERAAFAYYHAQIQQLQTSEEIGSMLLNAAEYTHLLLRREHRSGCCEQMLGLWAAGLQLDPAWPHRTWEQAMEQSWEDAGPLPHTQMMENITLSRRVWAALLEGETTSASRAEVVQPMLERLAAQMEQKKITAEVSIPIHLGLTQYVLHCHTRGADGVDELAGYIYFSQCQGQQTELAAGLAGMLLVACCRLGSAQGEAALVRLRTRCLPQLHMLLGAHGTCRELSLVLLYAQWAARLEGQITLVHYALWVGKAMEALPPGRVDMAQPDWQLDLLACLLAARPGQTDSD